MSPRIAVIGGGAAGLVAARVLQRELSAAQIIVLEKEAQLGGVWHYHPPETGEEKYHPMYSGLRTNLPKEIMGFREYPWTGQHKSFLTHQQVNAYLQEYAEQFGLKKYLSLKSKVTSLKIVHESTSVFQPEGECWPSIKLDWTVSDEGTTTQECTGVFDAVCICNGHYSLPSTPHIPGLSEYFDGIVTHSVSYDNPQQYAGQRVLCVGGRASGSDIARELVQSAAAHVYVSDTSCTRAETRGSVTYVPQTVQVRSDGTIRFAQDCPLAPSVDTIIFCTGYDYHFPFIRSQECGLALEAGGRRVKPVYEQLWHAVYPNVAFVGLPHSVVPFPLFELQMEAFAKQLQKWSLATPAARRLKLAEKDATSGGWKRGRVPLDTHYLGSGQWDYCLQMAKYAGILDKEMEQFIETNKMIYDHAGAERGKTFPGSGDVYREIVYHRDFKTNTFEVAGANSGSFSARELS